MVGQDQLMDPSIPAVSVHLPVTAMCKVPHCEPVMQRQKLPAAATSAAIQLLPNPTVIAVSQQQPSAIELLPNSTVIALSQQQPSAAPATQPSAAVPTAATGGTLDVLPSHDMSGPAASRLLEHVREGQGRLGLKVKGPTMPTPAVPTAASLPIGTLGSGQPIRAPQEGRQAVGLTEFPLSTQPSLPLSAQSGGVHSSPMNQIILNEPARSQTHPDPSLTTGPPQARKQNPQQRSESAADPAVHPLSSPEESPLSPVHPLSSPRGSPVSPVHPLSSLKGSASSPESARRKWLLTDSFRQRQATCKETLKAAQQDVLGWLQDHKVVQTYWFLCCCDTLRIEMRGLCIVYSHTDSMSLSLYETAWPANCTLPTQTAWSHV